jgi:hypothetical protein
LIRRFEGFDFFFGGSGILLRLSGIFGRLRCTSLSGVCLVKGPSYSFFEFFSFIFGFAIYAIGSHGIFVCFSRFLIGILCLLIGFCGPFCSRIGLPANRFLTLLILPDALLLI